LIRAGSVLDQGAGLIPQPVLISGATGFVGRHLVRHLTDRGITVGCVVRDASDTSTVAKAAAIFPHRGSTEDLRDIVGRFAPRCILHLASYFTAEHQAADVEKLIGANLLFATQLADAAASAQVELFVNTGTSWQHYDGAAYNPVCLYAATKQAFDDILRYYRERFGLRVVTLELSDTYGPGDPRKKLVPLLVERVKDNQTLQMSAGEQRISLVFISDVVDAFVRALEIAAGLAPGEEARFGVGAAEQPRLRDLVALVEREAGVTLDIRWGERPYRQREVMAPWQGPALPGWRPKIDLSAGIRRVLRDSDVRG
jgi:nucleoside-diphosphate-sugar epimerase